MSTLDAIMKLVVAIRQDGEQRKLEMPWQDKKHITSSEAWKRTFEDNGLRATWTSEPRFVLLPSGRAAVRPVLRRQLTLHPPDTHIVEFDTETFQ